MSEDHRTDPPKQIEEPIPEPEVIQEARTLIRRLTELVDAGEVEAISCYVESRDGGYRNLMANGPSRHEDAGRILELALLRLGFVQREHVREMIEEGDK